MLKSLWYYFSKYLGSILSDSMFSKILFFINTKRVGGEYYKLNIGHPLTFNEKINYLKKEVRNPISPIIADKYLVRGYVSEKVGDKYLVPLLKVFDSYKDVNFDELPQKFVLKANHGSGWNVICQDKAQLDKNKTLNFVKEWFDKDSYFLSREWHYKQINKKAILEELLEYDIVDYKFFCTKGRVHFVQLDFNRFSNHMRNIYDVNWELQPFQFTYKNLKKDVPKPSTFEEMIQVAEKLSEDFDFARVDLYEHNNKVFFGEITLHPEGGVGPFMTYQQDLEFGKIIKL